jgi:glucosamine-6-phosphate deaminase
MAPTPERSKFMNDSTNIEKPLKTLQVGKAKIEIYSSAAAQGKAAAARGSEIIRAAIARRGHARVIIATGNSQDHMVATLVQAEGIDWKLVEAFHMDEYLGISADHPASFRRWLREHLIEKVSPGQFHLLQGDAQDPTAETRRYERLLLEAPIDVCFLGIGENGHIAFNDPHTANFNDPEIAKTVTLDERCRKQQVGEGHFANIEEVPHQAISLTCTGLMRSENLICCVPESRKAEAVRNALEGEIATSCPGSLLRTHPHSTIYLDRDSAALLSEMMESRQGRLDAN